LKHSFHGNTFQMAKALIPMSGLAAILFLAAIALYSNEIAIADATIRSCFIGLSAVAVPHLLLHVCCDAMQLKFDLAPSWKMESA
ncbi:MAG: hypothetical protein AAGA30_08765, partial [Planctomycetota bacterium]